MANIVWEYGKWDSFWGYICGQCHTCFLDQGGALRHEIQIDANGGICPIKQQRDRKREEEESE